jgi:hypothetical protein
MALDRIENLLEKYFEAETSIAEENELKVYFSSSDVAQHLQQYQTLFVHFNKAKEEQFTATIPLKTKKRKYVAWLSIAASLTILFGIGTFMYMNNQQNATPSEYGTYEDPEVAFKETQKALAMISENVNTGIESVNYITEYQNSKEKIFKQ